MNHDDLKVHNDKDLSWNANEQFFASINTVLISKQRQRISDPDQNYNRNNSCKQMSKYEFFNQKSIFIYQKVLELNQLKIVFYRFMS